jgi:hypothetical protein
MRNAETNLKAATVAQHGAHAAPQADFYGDGRTGYPSAMREPERSSGHRMRS